MPNRDTQPKQPAPQKPPERTEAPALKTDKAGDKKKWDIIDENAWESFPASDPPASWAGRDIPPDEREAMAEAQAKEKAGKQPAKKD